MKNVLIVALAALWVFMFNSPMRGAEAVKEEPKTVMKEKPKTAKEMLEAIKGKYTLDDNGNVTYVHIIEVPGLSRDEIFVRAQNYFTYNYGSGKSVIQTNDKEQGILVGKGLYKEVHTGVSLVTTVLDAWHILRIDVKEGRARAIVTLTDYDKTVSGGNTRPSVSSTPIAAEYPINPKGAFKTVMTKAFYKTHERALSSLDAVEKAIKEGSTSKSIENSDW